MMDKKENNKQLIDIIREERRIIMEKAREGIINGTESVLNNANNIISLLNYDDANIKKYQALKEAQELIESLINEIAHAKSKEDIEKLRTKLNYYINKIKNEAKKRNIDYTNYYESVCNIRKNISKCVRILRKENQLVELETANNNYDNLSIEEQNKLNKRVKYEKSYNKRNSCENMEVASSKKEITTNSSESDVDRLKRLLDASCTDKKIGITNIELNERVFNKELETFESDEDYISHKVSQFEGCYKLVKTHKYNGSICENVSSFIKNIPAYNTNKKAIKRMYFDYSYIHRKKDLRLYIKYVKKSNSIKEGLKGVFGKSSLYNKENMYLENHDRCVQWIMSYIDTHHVKLNYTQAK